MPLELLDLLLCRWHVLAKETGKRGIGVFSIIKEDRLKLTRFGEFSGVEL